MHSENGSTETMPLWPDAARRLDMGKNLAYEAAARGEFPGAVKIGGKWIVSKVAFQRWLENPTPLRAA